MHGRRRLAPLLAAGLPLLLCVCACGGLLLTPAVTPQLGLRAGYVTEVCVGVSTTPRLRVGVTWISPYFSSLPPVRLQNPACAVVPWLPLWPQRGGFAWPP